MNTIDFVFVDEIAVGLLVSEEGCKRFCGASHRLESIDGLIFADVEEAQEFVSRQLRPWNEKFEQQSECRAKRS